MRLCSTICAITVFMPPIWCIRLTRPSTTSMTSSSNRLFTEHLLPQSYGLCDRKHLAVKGAGRHLVAVCHHQGLVSHSRPIVMLGSCFTENIGSRLENELFYTVINPSGTLHCLRARLPVTVRCKAHRVYACRHKIVYDRPGPPHRKVYSTAATTPRTTCSCTTVCGTATRIIRASRALKRQEAGPPCLPDSHALRRQDDV